jgi:drug/metabolite transporter (DMT)-like permease
MLFVPLYLHHSGSFRSHLSWWGIGFAVLASALGTIATISYSSALSGRDVGGAVIFVAAYPALSMILAVPILGETLTWTRVIGMLLVITGVWVAR